MNKQLHARKRRQFKSLSKQLNRLLRSKSTSTSKRKIEVIALKIRHLLRELSGIIAQWEMKKMLGAAAVIFGLATTSVQGQSFAEPMVNPFELSSSVYINLPTLADMDNDGDLDLLISEYDNENLSNFAYYENIGTASEPEFGPVQMNPFGLVSESSYTIFSAVVDLDNDGDLDVFGSTYRDYTGTIITYYENTGTASAPSFNEGEDFPFGTASLSSDDYVTLAFADLDGDSDLDLLAGVASYNYAPPFQYLENIGTASEPNFATPVQSPFGLSFPAGTYTYFPLHVFADLDSDGDIDMICGITGYSYIAGNEYYNGAFYFENTGTATNPEFVVSEINPLGIVHVSYENLLIPTLGDLDDDGDIDMLATSFYGTFYYYKNIEPVSTTTPQVDFLVNIFPNPTNDFLNINTNEPLSQIEIYDLFGRQLATYKGGQSQISIQDLSSGTYMIRLINEQGKYLSQRIEKL